MITNSQDSAITLFKIMTKNPSSVGIFCNCVAVKTGSNIQPMCAEHFGHQQIFQAKPGNQVLFKLQKSFDSVQKARFKTTTLKLIPKLFSNSCTKIC